MAQELGDQLVTPGVVNRATTPGHNDPFLLVEVFAIPVKHGCFGVVRRKPGLDIVIETQVANSNHQQRNRKGQHGRNQNGFPSSVAMRWL